CPAESVTIAPREGLYQQETEVAILKILASRLKSKTFIDVGAEKGSFAAVFFDLGFEGALFEPFAEHLPVLQKLVEGRGSRVFPYAIDATDHEGRLHIATDGAGRPLEYFHSLQASPSATNFHHDEGVPVTCRSLESLAEEGAIAWEVGLVKIDTEGNDLKVMEGMGQMRSEVLMCEFVTPSLYPDWQHSFPEGLMAAARAMGYEHCIAVSRFEEHEMVEMNPVHFVDGQWGNLIFTSAEVLRAARTELDSLRDQVQGRHVSICIRDHRELRQKEAMIQEQARQLQEKESVIHEQVAMYQKLEMRLGEKTEKIADLRNKIATLKEKNDKLRARR
ncbi:MAG: FkbM family methyltransferase, partial [Roseimicrobium sp.]